MDKEAQKRLADDFVELLRTTNRDGIEELIRYLQEETDFFTAPASTKYHGAFESGLLMHSINVCAELNLDPNSKVYPPETIIIVALLHDICKANCYHAEKRNVKENGVWVKKQVYVFEDEQVYQAVGRGSRGYPLAHGSVRQRVPGRRPGTECCLREVSSGGNASSGGYEGYLPCGT